MSPTPEKIEELQRILKDEYAAELSEGEAMVVANRMLLLYSVIYKRHQAEEDKLLQKGEGDAHSGGT